jgi:hypothetical protein
MSLNHWLVAHDSYISWNKRETGALQNNVVSIYGCLLVHVTH